MRLAQSRGGDADEPRTVHLAHGRRSAVAHRLPQPADELVRDRSERPGRVTQPPGGGELATYSLSQPLHAPGGLAVAHGVVWIADTDAHAVLRLDTHSGALHHVPIGE